MGVTVTPEDDEVINTLSGRFTEQLEKFAEAREAALAEHKELLLASRSKITSLSAERAKLVARLRVVDSQLADLAKDVRAAEAATEEVNAKHAKQVADLEAGSRGDMDRVKTAVARRDATTSIANLLKSLAKAGEVARQKVVGNLRPRA